MKSKKIIVLISLLLVSLLLVGCFAKPVAEIKDDKFVGKQVKVKGEVSNTIKLGSISGFTLIDDAGDRISVSTSSLPAEGVRVTVTGTLNKDKLFGYYIDADN